MAFMDGLSEYYPRVASGRWHVDLGFYFPVKGITEIFNNSSEFLLYQSNNYFVHCFYEKIRSLNLFHNYLSTAIQYRKSFVILL